MIKEKALSKVKGYLTDLIPSEGYDEVEEIIKALEQECVLDKIRTEIDELPSYVAKFNGGDFAIHIDKEKVFEVIDKYMEEGEDKG